MHVKINGRHITVTPAIREYVEEKIAKLERAINAADLTVDVVIRHDKNPSIAHANHVEITGHVRDFTLRVEEAAADMYEAIDLATARFERQARKYKTRVLARRHEDEAVYKANPQNEAQLDEDGRIVRSKQFEARMMSEDEAILQMEMLGHDFFMFYLDPTGETAVVYRRDAGDYGLLRMEENSL